MRRSSEKSTFWNGTACYYGRQNLIDKNNDHNQTTTITITILTDRSIICISQLFYLVDREKQTPLRSNP